MRGRRKTSGQGVVEMILILPVFLGIVFTIMEIGNVSFRLIVLNHATYEVARVGGMTWMLPSGGPGKLSTLMTSILPQATVSCTTDKTLLDPQAQLQNMDLVCTGSENVKLFFRICSIFLSCMGAPPGTRARHATVRMPIEQPLAQ